MDDRLVTLTKPTDAPLELGNFISQIFFFKKIHICYVFFENVMNILVFLVLTFYNVVFYILKFSKYRHCEAQLKY